MCKEATRTIGKSFERKIDPNGYRWANVGDSYKEFYWREFQKNVVWNPAIHESAVKEAFLRKAADRYADFVGNIKNPKILKENKVHESIVSGWKRMWEEEKYFTICQKNAANRRGGNRDAPAQPTHTGGQHSFNESLEIVSQNLEDGEDSTFVSYTDTHTKKHDKKTWITDKAATVAETYRNLREEVTREGIEVAPGELFYVAADGHDKKNRVYGTGIAAQKMPKDTPRQSRRASTSAISNMENSEVIALRKELTEFKAMVEARDKTILEELQKLRNYHGDNRFDNEDGDGSGGATGSV